MTNKQDKPRSKNHQEAARSASSLSPRDWRPSALLNASTADSNVDRDTAPEQNDDHGDAKFNWWYEQVKIYFRNSFLPSKMNFPCFDRRKFDGF